jgi:hypothetical protein
MAVMLTPNADANSSKVYQKAFFSLLSQFDHAQGMKIGLIETENMRRIGREHGPLPFMGRLLNLPIAVLPEGQCIDLGR